MTECIILYNYPLPDRISCGFFRENSLIVLTKVLLFSIPSITLPRIDCPYHKANQHNFIDGRAPLLTSGEADFGNCA